MFLTLYFFRMKQSIKLILTLILKNSLKIGILSNSEWITYTYINIYYACINKIQNFVQMIYLKRNLTWNFDSR